MPTNQPQYTGQANQQNRATIRNEDDIDKVLRDSEAQDGQDEREGNHGDDHQPLLPGFCQKAAVELLDERNYSITGGDHHQDTRPPGAEACEKAQECAESLVGPNVNRAFTWE